MSDKPISDGSTEYCPEYVEGLEKIAREMALCLSELLDCGNCDDADTTVDAYYKYIRDNSGD